MAVYDRLEKGRRNEISIILCTRLYTARTRYIAVIGIGRNRLLYGRADIGRMRVLNKYHRGYCTRSTDGMGN